MRENATKLSFRRWLAANKAAVLVTGLAVLAMVLSIIFAPSSVVAIGLCAAIPSLSASLYGFYKLYKESSEVNPILLNALGVITFSAALAIALLAIPTLTPFVGLVSWIAATMGVLLLTMVLPMVTGLIKPSKGVNEGFGWQRGRSPSEAASPVRTANPLFVGEYKPTAIVPTNCGELIGVDDFRPSSGKI